MDEELERRRSLTFKQAEGLEPLPRQLERNEISKRLRARAYNAAHKLVREYLDDFGYVAHDSDLYKFLRYKHFEIDSGYVNTFRPDDELYKVLNAIREGEYDEFYETIQQLCRWDGFPYSFCDDIAEVL